MEDANLLIWNMCSSTDPKHTKSVNNGRFKFTCVDPQYQSQQATEMFGPYGMGWGIENTKFTMLGRESEPASMMLEADFYYTVEGKKYSFPYAVDLKFRVGDDICKKLMTSLQSKCLSKLGFASDVYLGQFDDISYVKDQEVKNYRPDKKRSWLDEVVKKIEACENMNQLRVCKERVDSMVDNKALTEDEAAGLFRHIYEKQGGWDK